MENRKSASFLGSLYEFAKLMDTLGKCGEVSKSEMAILTTINLIKNDLKEEVTTAKISEFQAISKPATSQMLKSLEEKNYISRQVCKTNRRITLVDFTDEGEQVFKKQIDNFLSIIDKIFEKMQDDDIEKLIHSLNEFVKISKEECTRF